MEKLMKAFRQFFGEENCKGITEEILLDLLSFLEPREARIIELCFGLNGQGSHTLKKTGELIRISPERVRQLQYISLRKLQYEHHRRLLAQQVKNQADLLLLPVSYLRLDARAINLCNRMGIVTIKELISRSKAELLFERQFGPHSLSKLEEKLAQFNLALKKLTD